MERNGERCSSGKTEGNWRNKAVLNARDLELWFPRPRVYQLLNSPDFPAFRVGRRFYVSTDAFLAWMGQQARRQAEL